METTTEKKGDNVLVIYLNGRLDASTAGGLQQEINTLVNGGEEKLLINFEKLDYISSAGLRVLITTVKLLKSKQGKLVLAGMSGSIFEVLKISGFTAIFNIFDTEEEALATF